MANNTSIRTRNLYLLVGPSASGKTMVANALEDAGYNRLKTYTTRQPRYPGEEGYHFISKEAFEALGDKVFAPTKYNGNYYGCTAELLDAADIAILEPSGVCEVLAKYKTRPVVVIGISCTMNELEARMRKRGDSDDTIKSRLEIDCTLFGCMNDICNIVVNNNKDRDLTISTVKNYIDFMENICL